MAGSQAVRVVMTACRWRSRLAATATRAWASVGWRVGAAGRVGVPGGQHRVVPQGGEYGSSGDPPQFGAAAAADAGLAVVGAGGVVMGAQPGVLTMEQGGAESARVAGLGQDRSGSEGGQPGMLATTEVSSSSLSAVSIRAGTAMISAGAEARSSSAKRTRSRALA